MKKIYSIGIDIGGTKISGCALDESNNLIKKYEEPTPITDNTAVINKVEIIIDKILNTFHFKDIYGIGISTGGDVNHITGEILSATDSIPGWKGTQLGDILRKKYQCPVFVDNDGYMAVYAEWLLGAAKGYNNVAGLTLGTGLGGGIILDSKIVRGFNNSAANFGFIDCPKIFKNSADNEHNLEYYLSGMGLIRLSKIITPHKSFNSPQDIFNSSETDKQAVEQIFSAFFLLLEYCLNIIKHTISPEIIVIGGGIVSKNPDFFKSRFLEIGNNFPFPIVTALLNNDAGMIGAALALKEKCDIL